jgi:hypothetical protein
MRYDEITMYGPLYIEHLDALPTYVPGTDDKRIVSVVRNANENDIYFGDGEK